MARYRSNMIAFIEKLHKESEARQKKYESVKSSIKSLARAKKGEVAHV